MTTSCTDLYLNGEYNQNIRLTQDMSGKIECVNYVRYIQAKHNTMLAPNK